MHNFDLSNQLFNLLLWRDFYINFFGNTYTLSLWSIFWWVALFMLGFGFHHWVTFKFLPNSFKLYSWWFTLRNHKKAGIPVKTDKVIDKRGFSVGYSYEHRCALWVSYIVSRLSVGVDIDRDDDFFADSKIKSDYQVYPEDYKGTGYDKGHLAPYASIDFNYKSSHETFAMTNIAPQHRNLNRKAWRSLEAHIRKWTHTKGNMVVIAGPIFSQRPPKLGSSEMSVPHSYYKVVYSIRHQQFIGFVFPNKNVSARDLWDHALAIDQVERITGYEFFNRLSKSKQKNKINLDIDWWRSRD